MGSGSWTAQAFNDYSYITKGVSGDTLDTMNFSAQEFYKSSYLKDSLNPENVIRECCDSDEHPETIPVILALDVTGSMGDAAVKVAKRLNTIMTDLYSNPNIKDIEFCIMGIGDLRYDRAPIQISQFESDIRIAEQLDDIYFEGGGGGNGYESYTAAWYMGLNHTNLDCWKRNKKGIIITLGDELPNPYLPAKYLENATGDALQDDVDTESLYEEVVKKFNVYHLSVDDNSSCYSYHNRRGQLDEAWVELLGEDNYKVVSLETLDKTITDIITKNNVDMATISTPFFDTTTDVVTW